METRGDLRVVKGIVPLAQMFGYSSSLRSATQGRATYSMEPHSYAAVPPEIAAKFVYCPTMYRSMPMYRHRKLLAISMQSRS